MNSSFQCWFCEENLENHRYIIRDHFAICLKCYDKRYSSQCFHCQQIINIDTPGKLFQNQTWHEKCLICSICHRSLIDNQFAYENDQFFCRKCFIEHFVQQCFRCNRSLEPGEKIIIDYEKYIYHFQCFRCQFCQRELYNLDFYQRDHYFLCFQCHLRFVAIYCIKCHQAISNDGLIYHNHPFHLSCFLCTSCTLPIGNQRYIEYENEAFCLNCSKSKFRF